MRLSEYGDFMKRGGAYPHAFKSRRVGDTIEVRYRRHLVCTYHVDRYFHSCLRNIVLDEGNTEYYIKDYNVYKYDHESGETTKVVEGG